MSLWTVDSLKQDITKNADKWVDKDYVVSDTVTPGYGLQLTTGSRDGTRFTTAADLIAVIEDKQREFVAESTKHGIQRQYIVSVRDAWSAEALKQRMIDNQDKWVTKEFVLLDNSHRKKLIGGVASRYAISCRLEKGFQETEKGREACLKQVDYFMQSAKTTLERYPPFTKSDGVIDLELAFTENQGENVYLICTMYVTTKNAAIREIEIALQDARFEWTLLYPFQYVPVAEYDLYDDYKSPSHATSIMSFPFVADNNTAEKKWATKQLISMLTAKEKEFIDQHTKAGLKGVYIVDVHEIEDKEHTHVLKVIAVEEHIQVAESKL